MTDDEAVLAGRAARLSALLRATDPPVPELEFPAARVERARRARRSREIRWRAAAAAVLLLASAAFVPPVRAWIVDRAQAIWHAVGGAPAQPPAAPVTADPGPSAASVSFVPDGALFRVLVETRQERGALSVALAEGAAATATVSGNRSEAELLVLPDGLRIINTRSGTADYSLRLPASVVRVEVRVGTEPVRVIGPGEGREFTLNLGR